MAGAPGGFDDVWGNDELIAGLERARQANRLAHAYLVVGPKGIGKAALARALAAAILCESNTPGPCGQCVHCRRFRGEGHPDVHEVFPDGQAIKIDQIRSLRKEASLRPYLSARQVFILHQVDSLTDQAANSLLKLLEEPPEGTHLILLAARVRSVLPTILSRCQVLHLQRVPQAELARRLMECHPDLPEHEALAIAAESGGLPELAKTMASPDERVRLQEPAALRARVLQADPPELLRIAEDLDKNRSMVEKLLENLASWFGEVLARPQSGGEAARFRDPAKVLEIIDEIALARRLLRQNGNTRLILDVLFLEIHSRRQSV